ncbi:MAG: alkaline phosphatase family protein [Thermoanaerobaculia bacterium]
MKVRPGYLKRILGGAVFGLYIGHLVLFLNPQIAVSAGVVAPVVIAYAALWGFFLGSLLWLLRVVRVRVFGRPDGEFRPHGFGYVVAATFVSATIYWVHLAVLRIYLPPGAVRVLSKASILLAVTAIVLFALWLVERNAEARASAGIVLCALGVVIASSVLLYVRRAQYVERTAPPRPAAVVATPIARVTVVTVRSLSYDWLVTAEGEGATPHFQELRSRSYFARMQPFTSSSSRAHWASLATGKLPNRHGVTGRYSYRTLLNRNDPWLNIPIGVAFPTWGLIPPVDKIAAPLPSGNSLPLWAMFRQSGASTVVVNWPASQGNLGGGVRGASDRICRGGSSATSADVATIQKACGEAARSARSGEERLTRLDKRARDRIRDATIADRAATTAALELARDSGASLVILSLNQLDETARAVRHEGNSLPPAETAPGDAIRVALERIDTLIREIDRGIEGDVLIVVSPSSFDPPQIPSSPMSAASLLASRVVSPGTDEGFLLAVTHGRTEAANPESARVVDLVPTVLFAAGMPIARDLDGRVLPEALGDEIPVDRSAQYIQTYELGPAKQP